MRRALLRVASRSNALRACRSRVARGYAAKRTDLDSKDDPDDAKLSLKKNFEEFSVESLSQGDEPVPLGDLIDAKVEEEGLTPAMWGEEDVLEGVDGSEEDCAFLRQLETMTQEDVDKIMEEELLYFHAITEDRNPDVWPKQAEFPFEVIYKQTHYMQELVDMPLPHYDPMPEMFKKVHLFVKIEGMGLTPTEKDVLLEIVGKRYTPADDTLKLACNSMPTREQNLEGVKKLLWSIYNETKALAEKFDSDPEHWAEEVELPKPNPEDYRTNRDDHRSIKRKTRYRR